MWNWIVGQYNDIRGNLKWALLLGLWWLIAHYGSRMLQLIPNISPWMVWAIIVCLSLAAFVWVAKSHKIIQQPSAQSRNVAVSAAVAPMPTLSGLLGQAPQITFDAREFPASLLQSFNGGDRKQYQYYCPPRRPTES
jgi:hypothetical protein